MKKFIVALLAAIAIFICSQVREAAAQTKVKYAIMPAEGFSLQDGETHPVAPSLTQGLVVAHKWGNYGWVTEADVVSAFTAVNPSLQIVFGPSYFLSDKAYILPNAFARYIPVQKGKEDSFMLGGGLVLGLVISKEITLGTGIGFGKVVSGEPGPWCFTAGPKLSYTLPF